MSEAHQSETKKPPDGEVVVHVRHIGELEKVSFKISEQATLQTTWDRAYKELKITRDQRDTLQAKEGGNVVDLMPHLGLTLAQAREQGLTKGYQFEIAAATGGA